MYTYTDKTLFSAYPFQIVFSQKVFFFFLARLRHRKEDEMASSEIYVGPTTYKRFLDTFKRIYSEKAEERTQTIDRLKLVLYS